MARDLSAGRRAHRKSRAGCLQCKARKVKVNILWPDMYSRPRSLRVMWLILLAVQCDEIKPQCRSCVRRGVDCQYAVTAARETPKSSASFDALNSLGPAIHRNGRSILPELPMHDLELLHHYSTFTSYTLSQHPAFQTLWRTKAPQLGFSSPFLMRAILALSALHLAHLMPLERKGFYLSQAEFHHDVALQIVSPIVPRLMQEDSEALLLYSCLACFISCGKPRKQGDLLLMEGGRISEWLIFFRGTKTILDTASKESMGVGPLAPMFIVGAWKLRMREGESTEGQGFVQDLKLLMEEGGVEDAGELRVYFDALDEMSKSFAMVFNDSRNANDPSDILIWLLLVSDEFLSLLRQRRPPALVIFAYFCVIMRRLEWAWWMEGWSVHLVAAIYDTLDEVRRNWMQWPLEQVGWVPPDRLRTMSGRC